MIYIESPASTDQKRDNHQKTESNAAFRFYGRHLLLNFTHCNIDLNDVARIRGDLVQAVAAVGATIISEMVHQFEPQGVSVILMLAESHASVHTYPEHGSCFLDIFTCGESLVVERFQESLVAAWQPAQVISQLIERRDRVVDNSP